MQFEAHSPGRLTSRGGASEASSKDTLLRARAPLRRGTNTCERRCLFQGWLEKYCASWQGTQKCKVKLTFHGGDLELVEKKAFAV